MSSEADTATIAGEDPHGTVDALASEDGEARSHPSERALVRSRGAMIGRYVVLDTLGRGGMGIVYAAYDPQLDRKIALKLLLPGRGGRSARLRLQREAQAIAKLSHPNVVAVHDVGTVDDQVFIAMEFVDGLDLGRWRTTQARTSAQILDCYLQAGAGLAAAHAAGLVHRDFKPDNVLIGHDGRARVVDFGVVRMDETASISDGATTGPNPIDVPEALGRVSQDERDVELTAAGALIGTPAYMSPEQFLGEAGDARSDQFSFCVALYEGLYGERPFAGKTAAELSYMVTEGILAEPPASSRVPGRLRRVLLQGLAVDPSARFPDMPGLLAALRRAAAPRRGRWGIAAGLVAATAAAGGVWAARQPGRSCASLIERADAQWSPERKATVERAFLETALPYAPSTWALTEPLLDEHFTQWTALQQEVCESTLGLEPQRAADDPRQRCLDARLRDSGVLLDLFDQADKRVVLSATGLVRGLDSLEDCRSADRADRLPVPADPQLREQVAQVRQELSRWRTLSLIQRRTDADHELEALAQRAEELGYEPLRAELTLQLADRTSARNEIEAAIELTNTAFELALGSRHDEIAFQAANSLAYQHGVVLHERSEGLRWVRRAGAMLQRWGGNETARIAMLSNQGSILALAGEDEAAQEPLNEALRLARKLGDREMQATLLGNLGALHAQRRRVDPAREYIAESTALRTELLGPDHPHTLNSLANLTMLDVIGGDYEVARPRIEALLAKQREVLSPNSPEIANSLEALSVTILDPAELDEVIALRQQVVALRTELLGPDNLAVSQADNNLLSALIAAERYVEADALCTKMQARFEHYEDDPVEHRTDMLLSAVQVAVALDRPQQALAIAEEAYALCGEDDACFPELQASAITARGIARLAAGDVDGAIAELRRAMDHPAIGEHRLTGVRAHFALAQALYERSPDEAVALARTASELATGGNAQVRAQRAGIQAWLRARR